MMMFGAALCCCVLAVLRVIPWCVARIKVENFERFENLCKGDDEMDVCSDHNRGSFARAKLSIKLVTFCLWIGSQQKKKKRKKEDFPFTKVFIVVFHPRFLAFIIYEFPSLQAL